MTVTEATEVKNDSFPGEIMRNFIGDRCCLSALRFFAVHPDVCFNRLAVVHAIDEAGNSLEVENALDRMVEEGILKKNTENNTCFYALTGDDEIRRTVLNISLLDWREWRMILQPV